MTHRAVVSRGIPRQVYSRRRSSCLIGSAHLVADHHLYALDDPAWSNDLFQPPDLIEQSPDGYGPDPLSQRKRVLAGVDYIQGIEAEVR